MINAHHIQGDRENDQPQRSVDRMGSQQTREPGPTHLCRDRAMAIDPMTSDRALISLSMAIDIAHLSDLANVVSCDFYVYEDPGHHTILTM